MAASSGIWIRDAARRVWMTYWQLRKLVLNDGVQYRRRGRRIEVHPDDVRALEESIWQGRPVERREEDSGNGEGETDRTERTKETERTEQIATTTLPVESAAPVIGSNGYGVDLFMCEREAPCPSRSVVAGLAYCMRATGGCAWRRRG